MTTPQSSSRPRIRPKIIQSTGGNTVPPKKPRGNPKWVKGQVTNPKGRPKGVKNKFTLAKIAAESGELPLMYMLRVMRDSEHSVELRLQAAQAAAPYLHRKMPIGIEQMPGRYGSLTAAQLRGLPTPALQQLLQASQVFYQKLVALGVAQPGGEIIDVNPT